MNAHLLRPQLRLSRSLRVSRIAGLVASLAVVSFVLFEAVDLDGLAQALTASPPPLVLAASLADPEADRLLPYPGVVTAMMAARPLLSVSVYVTPRPAAVRVTRPPRVRPRRLPARHSSPAADPV